ncbi:MAG: outer membrane protein assembly factor BamE [Flavobacteriaceae bacterium]|jgi:outer membrane protein assembly factor BamE (lipoprotein component of BamABCDE complex)|nr:outer membrane protein assembly factor BamE [Flavobacteriaceae bacterium]
MKKIIFLSLVLLLSNCTLNKVVQHHGVHNLEKKQLKLKINTSNKNDITKIIGPPSTKSTFDNDVYIYIERKTSSSRLTKLGKKKLLTNNILILEIDSKGVLVSKKFYDKKSMQKIKFEENITNTDYSKRSFVFNFLSSLRQKIDDPLGKKRAKVNQQ